MEPVLEMNPAWTALPEPLTQSIAEELKNLYSHLAPGGTYICEGRLYATEVLVRLGFRHKGEISQANFEVAVIFDIEQQQTGDVYKVIWQAFDLAHNYFNETHLADREKLDELPRHWHRITDTSYFRFSPVNSDLEAEADRLLGELDPNLVKGPNLEDALDFRYEINDPDELIEVVRKFKTKGSETIQ